MKFGNAGIFSHDPCGGGAQRAFRTGCGGDGLRIPRLCGGAHGRIGTFHAVGNLRKRVLSVARMFRSAKAAAICLSSSGLPNQVACQIKYGISTNRNITPRIK